MKKICKIVSLFIAIAFLSCGCGAISESETEKENTEHYCQILVGNNELESYSIVLPKGAGNADKKNAKLLREYIHRTIGSYLPIVRAGQENGNPAIRMTCAEDTVLDHEVYFRDGDVYLTGLNSQAVEKAVYEFVNTYLGWAFAGESREHIINEASLLHLPTDKRNNEEIWIEEREAIVCLWKTNTSRGAYYNGNTSLKSDLMSYSDDQLYEYIKMLKYCGFTGIQITDMCANWAAFGGYEFVHEKIRFMADAAHSLNMNFTLWVWGAEFTGYGWVDESVMYADPTWEKMPREYEGTIETFDKYYTIYAELADCSDRLIAHYVDPGKLAYSEDVAFYAKMLQDKVKAINPDIIFGVNFWQGYLSAPILMEQLGNDWVAYEGGHVYDNTSRTNFRSHCQDLGLDLGTWSWNAAEMEIDQLAEMNVNAKILQKIYQEAVTTGDIVCKSSYWSEMDSYHMLNLFSLYCAGQLLQNPYTDTDELLLQIASAVVGEDYAADMFQILSLIQDARSGDCWETFYWSCEDYLLLSDQYPAEDILQRCDKYIPILEEMIRQELEKNIIPLPISTTDLLKLILPHLQQIRDYAVFRVQLAELENEVVDGADQASVAQRLADIYKPIPEYNCIIGMWGQTEARAQYELIVRFCDKTQIDIPRNSVFEYYRKQRIYQEICSFQKGASDIYYMQKDNYQMGLAFGKEETARLVEELVAEGLLCETEDGRVYLSDWEDYRFHFN